MLRDRYFLNKVLLTCLLAFGGGLMLTGCESPNPAKANILPDGYVWQSNTPLKAPPKTQPWLVDDNVNPVAHDLSKEQWLHATDDLVTSLADQRGGLPSSVFLQPAGNETSAAMRGYDSYLRELLITRGVGLTTNKEEAGGRLVYDISAPGDESSLTRANVVNTRTQAMSTFLQDRKGKPVLKLSLAIQSGGQKQAVAQGLYHVHGQEMERYEWALMPTPRYEQKTQTGNYNE